MRQSARSAAASLTAAVLVSACSILDPRPDPSRFFVLSPAPAADASAAGGGKLADLSVGLGPISVPDYANRPEIVVRNNANEVQLEPVDRWAEPLSSNVSQVLMQNLAQLLGTERVTLFPWYGTVPKYQVQVDIVRFDQDDQRRATLIARWEIRDVVSKSILAARQTDVTRPGTGDDTAAGVAALSATLADLSRDIADAVRSQKR